MSTAPEPSPASRAGLEDLRTELHAALRAGDDRLTILTGCQMLACAEIKPDDRLNVIRIRAAARRRSSHFAAAADDWTRLLEVDRNDRAAFSNRGVCLYEMGDFHNALEDLLAAEALCGGEVNDMLWRGACRYRLGDVAGARREFRSANALEPDNAAAWDWRAVISDPDGDDLQTSLDEVERVIVARPQAWSHRHRRARLLVALGRPREAIPELDIVLAAAPDEGEIQLYRAEVKEAAGDLEGAIADLRALIARSRDHTPAHQALIALLRRLGRRDEALAAADAFARVAGHWAGVHVLRGEILRDMGQPSLAASAFRTGFKISPWDRACGQALALQLRACGDPQGALEVLEKLDRSYFTPDVARLLADALYALGRSRDALAVLDRVIGRDANDVAALLLRADVRRASGRIKEAREDRDRARHLEQFPGDSS